MSNQDDPERSLRQEQQAMKLSVRSSRMGKPALYKELDRSSWMGQTPPGASRKKFEDHDFPGYGTYDVHHTPRHSEMEHINRMLFQEIDRKHKLLNELEATAIAGNDILSSTFYVSGLVTLSAGIMAPICLTLVGLVLYLFRGIYHETVTALPSNGGTYNILLNCTSKQFASASAVLGIIAFITTGVVSSIEAVAYLKTVTAPYYDIDKGYAAIFLLGFFCVLTNLGMQESATFAKVVFVLHVAVLTLLTLLGTCHILFHSEHLIQNFSTDTPSFPTINMAGTIVT